MRRFIPMPGLVQGLLPGNLRWMRTITECGAHLFHDATG
jgi:hypothetical protein